MIDSGAHYLEGTTDITRVLKLYTPVKNKVKNAYTYLLKSLLKLEKKYFSKKLLASELDFFIRSYLHKFNITYGHGTGHGVGYFNDVHEKYPIISPLSNQKILDGNFFSIEPGFYVSNEFGLRIENLYFAKKYNNGIKLEGVTLVPYDLELVNWKLINNREELIKPMAKTLAEVYKNIFRCNICGSLKSNTSGCNNCENNKNKFNKICVVENVADQWSIETSSVYQGYFHILGGTISSTNNQKKEDLLINSLVERVKKDNIEEVILATSATVEGQTTAFYIQDSLRNTNVKISKLAQGLPVGGEIENLDDGTLISAFKNRQSFEK